MFDRTTFYASHQHADIGVSLQQCLTLLTALAVDEYGDGARAVAVDHTVTPLGAVGRRGGEFLVTMVGIYEPHM